MTKANMIEEIQNQEAKLWLDLADYENKNAPDDGDFDHENEWSEKDVTYREKLNAWHAIYMLMKSLDIEPNRELENYKIASEIRRELFIRRQASKGIYYDEHGNRIA